MKTLTSLLYVACSLAFSQEKGHYCSVSCQLYYPGGTYADHYAVHGYNLGDVSSGGMFQVDPSDSNIVEITIPYGDSLLYHGGWIAWGPCFPMTEPEDLDSVVTFVEGSAFPLTVAKHDSYSPDYDYIVTQDGIIRQSCLIRIKAAYLPDPKEHFVRVIVEEPVVVEEPPVYTDEILFAWTDQQTLVVKKDAEAFRLNTAIYSLSGQLLQQSAAEGEQVFDIGSFQQGCYIVQTIDESGVKKQLKFVR